MTLTADAHGPDVSDIVDVLIEIGTTVRAQVVQNSPHRRITQKVALKTILSRVGHK